MFLYMGDHYMIGEVTSILASYHFPRWHISGLFVACAAVKKGSQMKLFVKISTNIKT